VLGGIGGEVEGFAAASFEEFAVAHGIGDVEAEVAGLASAEKIRRGRGGGDRFSAISKTVGGAHHGFERARASSVHASGATRMQWDFLAAATDAAAKLVSWRDRSARRVR